MYAYREINIVFFLPTVYPLNAYPLGSFRNPNFFVISPVISETKGNVTPYF